MIGRRAALASALGLALLAPWGAARATEVRTLFPTDHLTVSDPAQLTGRRVRLPRVNCAEVPSTCDEIALASVSSAPSSALTSASTLGGGADATR